MRIVVETLIRAPRDVVFDLELDMDVHTASTGRSKELATTSTGRRILGPGDEVTFTATHLGLRWRMTSRVTEHHRPEHFVDEQTRGPFATVRHEHAFEAVPEGTLMRDTMTFTLPAGPAGRLAARLVAGPLLKKLLVRRGAYVKEQAETARP